MSIAHDSMLPCQASDSNLTKAEAAALCGLTGSAIDIAELISIQQALREQMALIIDLIESNPLPTCLTDSGGRFISVNGAWEVLTGRSRETVIGRRDFDCMSKDEADAHCLHHLELLQTGGSIRYEQRLCLPHVGVRDLQLTKILIAGLRLEPSRVLTFARDVTEVRSQRAATREGICIVPASNQSSRQTASGISAHLAL